MPPRKRLGQLLTEMKIVDEHQLQSALGHQKQWGGKLGAILVQKGFCREDQVVAALSQHLAMPAVRLRDVKVDPRAVKMVSKSVAERLHAPGQRPAVEVRLERRRLPAESPAVCRRRGMVLAGGAEHVADHAGGVLAGAHPFGEQAPTEGLHEAKVAVRGPHHGGHLFDQGGDLPGLLLQTHGLGVHGARGAHGERQDQRVEQGQAAGQDDVDLESTVGRDRPHEQQLDTSAHGGEGRETHDREAQRQAIRSRAGKNAHSLHDAP